MFLLSAGHFCWFGTYSRGGEYPQVYFITTISKIFLHFIRKFCLSKNTSKLETLLTIIALQKKVTDIWSHSDKTKYFFDCPQNYKNLSVIWFSEFIEKIFINFQDSLWDIKVLSSQPIFKFNVICSKNCDFYHLYVPTDAHKLYKVTNYLCVSLLLAD
jgi:hypothetical protein